MNDILERAHAEGAPVIDGDTATFVWEGKHPPALGGEFNNWNSTSMLLEESAPGQWTRTYTFPRDTYLEYLFFRDGQHLFDPLNSHTVDNGLGLRNNYFAMPDWEETPLSRHKHQVPRGTVTRHVLPTRGLMASSKRAVHLYEPPVGGPYPLLVVYDGSDYLHRGKLAAVADNLIAEGRVRPFGMAMLDNGKTARFLEYNCSDTTLAFLLQHVLPLAREHLDLLDTAQAPGAFGVAGASMGGLMALYTGMRMPEIFGRVLSQSGALGFHMEDQHSVIQDLVECGNQQPLQIWMDVGRYEWLLEPNRRFTRTLRDNGYDPTYREYNGGHNYTAWRNEVWRGLEVLFPPES